MSENYIAIPITVCLGSRMHHVYCGMSFSTCNKKNFPPLFPYVRLTAEPNQFRPDPARKLSANLYDIYHCCMYSEKLLMVDRGTIWNM